MEYPKRSLLRTWARIYHNQSAPEGPSSTHNHTTTDHAIGPGKRLDPGKSSKPAADLR